MARIPVVQEPSVRTEGLPTPYARPFATPQGEGAGFGQLLEQGAGVAAQYLQEARQKADAANIQGAWGAGQDLLNKTILDPEKGYSSLRGDDAMKGREKFLGDYNKGLDQINEKLTPDQQRMFEPHLRALREQGFTHTISHESVEMERYAQANAKGNIDSTMETMQMPQIIADPVQLKAQVDKLFQASIDEGKRRYGTSASKEALSSVIDPALQTAALGGMQAALAQAQAAGDPTIASNAFGVLGKYLLKNHQKQIGGMVEALTAKKAIADGAQAVISGATTSVILPDGGQVARVDGGKVAGGVADLKDDTPHLSEIQDAIEKKQARLNKVWDAAAGTVYQRVEGDALKGGGFDLDRSSAVDKEWLRKNAPDLLLKLQKEEDRGTRAAATRESHDAYSELMLDMDARREFYKDFSVPQFGKWAIDHGVAGLDLDKARKHFADVQKGGLSETINKTVAESLMNVFPDDKETQKHLQGDLLDATKEFVENWQKATQGQTPKTKDIRQFVEAELVSGKVKDVHWYYDPRVTRLEYQRTNAYRGKSFEPFDTAAKTIPEPPKGPPEVHAATPAEAPAPRVPQMSDADVAAIEWLGKNPNDPGAEKVRAKLRAKGIIGG
jgi:hypothetical protein